jgi:murein L,D-transpeptidase YcbB/YkuD
MKYRMPTMTNPKMIKKRVFLIDKLYHDRGKKPAVVEYNMNITRIKFINQGIIALIVIFVLLCSNSMSADRSSDSLRQDDGLSSLIKQRIIEWKFPSKINVRGERIYAAVLVESFYKGRTYLPAWSQNGLMVQVEPLIRAVEDAYGDGLTPDYYHLSLIRSLVEKVGQELAPDPILLSDLDILLTDAFLALGCHLSAGCVNPVTIETEWFAKSLKVDVSAVLEQALNKKQIREALMGLRPQKDIYDRLRLALAWYRVLLSKGEWQLISTGPSLKKGSKSDRVVELRKRLTASGDLPTDEGTVSDVFDEKVEQSIIVFQKCHGLECDGIVGRNTFNALNVPLKQRIRQMELNMERLRWILGNIEERFIVVNIANFQLDVIENDKSILSMKVVVGKPYQRTPIFTSKMTYIVINPAWNIPDSIARKEILKKIEKNPNYLAEQNIKVLEEVKGSRKGLPYRFRQEPGPLNPLGTIKFMFPNEYDVYLHDTSAKRLFSENVRTFSHGCTRIEKPLELAEYLFRDDPRWSRKELVAAIEKGTEQTVMIPHPVNVHFLYLTAWVDESGSVQFRNDVYGRDKSLDDALRKKPSLR